MIPDGEQYEHLEEDRDNGSATPPADAGTKMLESPPPMVPPRDPNRNPPPMVPPDPPPQVAPPDDSARVRNPVESMPPQVAPPREENKHSKVMPPLGPTK